MKIRTKRGDLPATATAAPDKRIHSHFAVMALLAICALVVALPGLWRLREHQRRMKIVAPPPIRYKITNLGTDGGRFTNVDARSINDRGQVVCVVQGVEDGGAFLWEKGRFRKLGPGVRIGPGRSLNNHGEVVGYGVIREGEREPHVVIFRGDEMVDTGIVGCGFGIDDECRVVGETRRPRHAFLYARGKTIDLGTLGSDVSTAQEINNAGQIVGTAGPLWRQSRAFLYSGGRMRDLGTLGGSWSIGDAINSKGWVVGRSQIANGGSRVFLFRDGKMEEMAGSFCEPVAINASGTVVGNYIPDQETFIPVVWVDGHKYNLQNLIPPKSGWTLYLATSINDRGQITVVGSHAGERYLGSCILTPVRESRTEIAEPSELL